MLGLPGTNWNEKPQQEIESAAPARLAWRLIGKITHTFTHFHLTLDVYGADSPNGFRRGSSQQWIGLNRAQLPTVMKKAVELASNDIGDR